MSSFRKKFSFLSPESYKKGLVWSVLFNLINYGLRLSNFLVIAFYFGSNDQTDIYFYLLGFFLIMTGFFIMLNNSVVIPESMRIRKQVNNKKSVEFLNFFIALYFIALIVIALFVALFPIQSFGLVSKFKHLTLADNISLFLFALPLIVLLGVNRLLTDIFTSYRFFTIPMVVGSIEGLFSILFVVLFHNVLNIKSALLGSLLAGTFNVTMLLWLMKYKLRWRFTFRWIKIEKRIWKNVLYAQVGNVTSLLTSYFPLYIMSGFGAGVITSLNYAQQISDAPNKFAIQQFSVVSGIKFNELHANKNSLGELNSTFIRVSNFLLFWMFPISSFLFFFTDDLVGLLFGYTKINSENLQNIALLLKYLGLLAPFVVINTMISRLFMATHKIKESYWYQVAMNILLLPMLYVLVKQLGLKGYPVAMLVFHCINVIAVYFLSKRFFKFLDYKKILEKFCILLLLNLFIGAITFYLVSSFSNFQKFVSGFFIYVALLLLLNHFFKINELVYNQAVRYLNRTKITLSKLAELRHE